MYCEGKGSVVKPSGPLDAKVLLVGEAPGADEVGQGMPFVGPAGNVLWTALRGLGYKRSEFLILNAVCYRCMSGNSNRNPSKKEVNDCYKAHFAADLLASSPNLIIALGGKALQCLTGRHEVISTPKRPGWWHSILSASEVELMQTRKDFVWPLSKPKMLVTIHPSFVQRGGFINYDNFKMDLAKGMKEAYTNEPMRMRTDYRLRTTSALNHIQAEDWAEERIIHPTTREAPIVALDLETERVGIPPRITLIGLSHKLAQAHVMSWTPAVQSYVAKLLANPQIIKVAHNSAFDVKVLLQHGFAVEGPVWCTMMGAQMLYSHWPVGLASVGPQFTDMPQWKHTATEDEPLYCGKDVDASMRLFQLQIHVLTNRSLMGKAFVKHAWDTLMPARRIFTEMEIYGMKIDRIEQGLLLIDLEKQKAGLLMEWEEMAPGVNPLSAKQKQKLFFEDLKLKPSAKTPKGAPSLGKDALIKMCKKYPKVRPLHILGDIQRLAAQKKQIDVPVDAMDIYHPTYKMHKGTGRVASGYPGEEPDKAHGSSHNNVMNVPPEYRKLYVPRREGYCFYEFDYSAIEFVIMCARARDSRGLKMYADREDIHSLVACEAFNLKLPDIEGKEDPRRKLGKKVVHGGNYGAQAKKVAEITDTTIRIATDLLNGFLRLLPDVARERKKTIALGKSQGWLENSWGRRCWFPTRNPNEMLAYGPQTDALEVAMETLVLFDKDEELTAMDAQVVAFTHDSFLFEGPEERGDEIIKVVRGIMERPIKQLNDLVVYADVKVGYNWGEMEEVTV